jgi:hypothetical protein
MSVDDDFAIPLEDEPILASKEPPKPAAGVAQAVKPAVVAPPAAHPPAAATSVASASAAKVIKSSLEAERKAQFKRPLNLSGQGATRCRMFHCKVAESSMAHLENQINDWLDSEHVEVKHVGHVVGMMEGKHTEPNVIVMVWY